MSKILGASLLGALSILLLAGLATVDQPSIARDARVALPELAPDAPRADTPRECSVADNVVTACTYQ